MYYRRHTDRSIFFNIALVLLLLSSILSSANSRAVMPEGALPQLRATVIASGTVHWELQYLKDNGLDKQNGFELQINRVASLSAARLALTGKTADTIVSDWLWAAERNQQGADLRFVPFSKQIGVLIAAKGSKLAAIEQLKGKRIGVAGSPLNKGWVLLQAAASQQGIKLRQEAEIQFGAPPLLSHALKKGQLDLLVTFWHFGARLEAEGYPQVLSLETLMHEVGLQSQLPMLGYLFRQEWIEQNPESVAGFQKALQQAKTALATQDSPWQQLRPLMKAENEQIFQALIAGYRNGIPAPLNPEQMHDAERFYRIIDQLKPQPTGAELDPVLFSIPGQP